MADNSDREGGNGAKAPRDNRNRDAYAHRIKRMRTQGLKEPIAAPDERAAQTDVALECGWGRLLFGQTFSDPARLISMLHGERPDRRDIAIYVRDPHVLLGLEPQDLFLDPSHTFRLYLSNYRPGRRRPKNFHIRRLTSKSDADAINRIYSARNMVPAPPDFYWAQRDARSITYFLAEDNATGEVLGTVTGIDHVHAFGDLERGSSLWCLAVDPQAKHPGIGEALVRRVAEHFAVRGAAYLDLSVLHDNEQAIELYRKLGFERVPFFSIKRKNPINESLFMGTEVAAELNPYARIICDEARRRGIHVDIVDVEGGFFQLTFGGRTVRCRESLSEFTSAVAMSICDDKAVTRRIVAAAGVTVPEQIDASAGHEVLADFLARHGKVVVKPARGEQGKGVAVGLSNVDEVMKAVDFARNFSAEVLVEQNVEGHDLRLVVINYRVVAVATRRPPSIAGDGQRTIRQLIEAQSRRRAAATSGESRIPVDDETRRTIAAAGLDLDSVLPDGEVLEVRKTANLHTGGTIHDVTAETHPRLIEAAIAVARAIDIPVVGVDFMVRSPREPDYAFIEANERPGLANHEPQPTAERFVDLLFPLSMPAAARRVVMDFVLQKSEE